MESSRIFVRGLPPQLTTDDFQRHFSRSSDITDARLIPHRRIGYVGYRTSENALEAVKYHNKSFINMSRIHVELARSVDQENAIKTKKHTFGQSDETTAGSAVEPLQEKGNSFKRKREDPPHIENDPKLQEYLGVMQPASKSKKWANEEFIQTGSRKNNTTTNSAVQSSLAGQEDNKQENQEVPRKRKKSRQNTKQIPAMPQESTPPMQPAEDEQPDLAHPITQAIPPAAENSKAPLKTDDDWLRSRTSRLLGLVDHNDEDKDDHNAIAPNIMSDDEAIEKGAASGGLEERSILPAADEASQTKVGNARQGEVEAVAVSGAQSDTAGATHRLFVRNLPYTTTADDLRKHFDWLNHGIIDEVHIPIDPQSGKNKGYAYVQYSTSEAASKALQSLDAEPFQGRLLHVIYAAAKRQSVLDDIAISRLPLKKQQQIKRKAAAASSTFNWNSLYMNADAVMSSISDRLGVPKSELLDPTSSDAAVKQAHAETHIIQETKSYFAANGVNLDAFKQNERGETAILIKNFSYGTKTAELQELFEAYGTIRRLLMPPSGTMAIVEFVQADHARTAFRSLAYRKLKDSILFLEKAPKDVFNVQTGAVLVERMSNDEAHSTKHAAGDLLEVTRSQGSINTSTLFVRNLNFSTTSERLREVFKPLDGLMSARVKTKPDPKTSGRQLSMGFGFLEFKSKEQAQAALATMDGHSLDGHELLVRASHKGVDAAEERRREDTAKKLAGRRTKIIIKNLPFEASKKDIRSLFSSYGQLRSVRVPKKFDSSTRGFAFAEFVTAREAENAMDALKDTHLLGRRLVLDFAAEDAIDPEQEIARMQQKAGKQADKVALQRLTGSGRKKFSVDGNENIDRG